MSRINIPLEALTSRLNLGSRFEGVRSQSIGTRFANLKPISEFLDLKRLSKPSNFGEVQSRINYNLSYFSSNYFAVSLMLTVYSLLTNFALLFDMIFMGVGLFGIKKLDGRDLELGFTRATTSQLYTGLFIIGVPLFIWASPISTALWLIGAIGVFFRGGGLGGRPRTPKDSPLWGRPSGARLGKRWGGSRKQTKYKEDMRFQELDSDEDDGQGVGLEGPFVSDKLHFTGGDLGRRQHRYEDPDSSEISDDDIPDDNDNGSMQLALRDKEEMLVQKALERIRRAQMLGEKNVKLTQPELDALERKRQKDQAMQGHVNRKGSRPDLRRDERRRSGGQQTIAARDGKYSKTRSKGHLPAYDDEDSSSSRRVTPPGIYVPGTGVVGFSQGKSSRPGSRSASSRSLAQPSSSIPHGSSKKRISYGPEPSPPPPSRSPNISRRLPDDADWIPRPRSSSSASGQAHPYDPYQYQTYSPPLSQGQPSYSHYGQSRRIVSSPQPDMQYFRTRGDATPRSPEPSSLRRARFTQGASEESDSADGFVSDDDEGSGVQVDVIPYGHENGINVRAEGTNRERQRRGGR